MSAQLCRSRFARLFTVCVLAFCALAAVPSFGASFTTFSGPAPGQGLDLYGQFLYAVQEASDGHSYNIGTAHFTDRTTAGYSDTFTNQTAFGSPNYGASSSDIALANVMDYVAFGPSNGTATFQATGLTVGQQYELQLMFNEACCNRQMDVIVNGVQVGTDIYPGGIQGGSQNVGAVFTDRFTATSSVLRVDLPINTHGSDPNPMLDAFTLQVVPEPSSMILCGLGAVGLLLAARRRKA